MLLYQLTENSWTIDQFLTSEECQEWIDRTEAMGYGEAMISTGRRQVMAKHVRNNERILLDDSELAAQLWLRLQPFVPAKVGEMEAIGLNERLRFYKYTAGQQFRQHQDGSYIRNIHEWSLFTFMVYLNEGMQGGATTFNHYEVYPETGKALIFLHQLSHAGSPVIAGVKYVLRSDVMYRRMRD